MSSQHRVKWAHNLVCNDDSAQSQHFIRRTSVKHPQRLHPCIAMAAASLRRSYVVTVCAGTSFFGALATGFAQRSR
eukprot:3939464-Amphidinium_carterae.2